MENKMPLLWKIKCRVLWNIVNHLQLIALGGFLDVTMYDPKPGTIGTPVPFFTAIFGVIAGILSLIGFIVMIVLMIVGAVRLSKSSKED